MVASGHHLTPPEGCPDVIKALMLSCWKYSPNDRRTFSSISSQLEEPNLTSLMGHANSCYGAVDELVGDEETNWSKPPDQEDLHASVNGKGRPLSWPKLSNFESVDIEFANRTPKREKSNTSIQSLEDSTKYTTVLLSIAEDEEATDEYLQPLRRETEESSQ